MSLEQLARFSLVTGFHDEGGVAGMTSGALCAETTRTLDPRLLVYLGEGESLWLAGLGASIVGSSIRGLTRLQRLDEEGQARPTVRLLLLTADTHP